MSLAEIEAKLTGMSYRSATHLRRERRARIARIAVSLLGILAGLFFSTPVMTGNTVGSSTSVNILGLVTLLLGFLGFYLSIKYNK